MNARPPALPRSLSVFASAASLALTGLVIVACAGEDATSSTPSGSPGTTPGDAAAPVDGSTSASDAGDAAPRERFTLKIDGVAIPLTLTELNAGTTTDFNGKYWVSHVRAPIENAAQYPFAESQPAWVQVHDEQTREIPLALGDFPCQRGADEANYGFTEVEIYVPEVGQLLHTVPSDPGCTVRLEQWANRLTGSLKGELVNDTVPPTKRLAVEVSWDIPTGGQ